MDSLLVKNTNHSNRRLLYLLFSLFGMLFLLIHVNYSLTSGFSSNIIISEHPIRNHNYIANSTFKVYPLFFSPMLIQCTDLVSFTDLSLVLRTITSTLSESIFVNNFIYFIFVIRGFQLTSSSFYSGYFGDGVL
jgi:hypothetical protein